MQVILIKDVDHLGGKDEVATVKNGYARNFLFPTKHAVEANPSNLKQLEERLKAKAKKEAFRENQMQAAANRFNAIGEKKLNKAERQANIYGNEFVQLSARRRMKSARTTVSNLDTRAYANPREAPEVTRQRANQTRPATRSVAPPLPPSTQKDIGAPPPPTETSAARPAKPESDIAKMIKASQERQVADATRMKPTSPTTSTTGMRTRSQVIGS